MLAAIATGVAKSTSCHPDAVSFVNVALASRVPPLDHRGFATWVPVFPAAL